MEKPQPIEIGGICCNMRGVIHEVNCKESKRLKKEWAKEHKLTNLEQITQAWSMGWSATLKIEQIKGDLSINFINAQIVGIEVGMFLVRSDDSPIERIEIKGGAIGKCIEITGYKYAGELAGNEKIDNDQLFHIKDSGIIVKYGDSDHWCEEEKEPYFE